MYNTRMPWTTKGSIYNLDKMLCCVKSLCTGLFFRGGGIIAMYLHFRENDANEKGPLLSKFLDFWFSNKRIR